jgi:hypothetical protein
MEFARRISEVLIHPAIYTFIEIRTLADQGRTNSLHNGLQS